jgi:hypothetical protein
MLKIKVTEKSGAWLEYISPNELNYSALGHGLPERPELDAEGNPTGNTLPAEYTVEITDISAEHALADCLSKRKAEYPSAEEFLNAFFDGGEQALAELQAKRLAVKAKYPKP